MSDKRDDTKPCVLTKKIPCEQEEKKKCKEPKPPPDKVSEPEAEPECVEPMPPEVVDPDQVYFGKYLAVDESENELDKITRMQFKTGLLQDCHVEPVFKILKECNKRVTRKLLYTAETCHEETVDLMEALDKCVKSKAFNRLA